MTDSEVVQLAGQAIWIATKLSAPVLLVSLAVGTLISLFQAVTQVQEMTITFVPKLAAIALVFVLGGGWMLDQMTEYTRALFEQIPRLVS